MLQKKTLDSNETLPNKTKPESIFTQSPEISTQFNRRPVSGNGSLFKIRYIKDDSHSNHRGSLHTSFLSRKAPQKPLHSNSEGKPLFAHPPNFNLCPFTNVSPPSLPHPIIVVPAPLHIYPPVRALFA